MVAKCNHITQIHKTVGHTKIDTCVTISTVANK